MANRTLTQATELAGVDIASNDELWIWDVTAAALRKCTRADLIGGVITGGGTVATGGFTLTVPATGTAALSNTAQTFTSSQTVDTVSSLPFLIQRNSANRFAYSATDTSSLILLYAFDNGTGAGPYVNIQRNNNASTPSAGFVQISDLNNTSRRIWPDAAGLLRIHNATPTNANDTSGTVVGDQTSSLDSKHVQGESAPIGAVLAAVRQGAEAVRRFVYKSGAYNGEEFSGVVVDYAPRYGMDRDAEHPAGKSLNVITAIGDLLMAVANLTERVEALERG